MAPARMHAGGLGPFVVPIMVVILCLFQAPNVNAFGIRVDAHEEECFSDTVKAGTKLGLTFQVAEGGFLDIDVTVRPRELDMSFVEWLLRIGNSLFWFHRSDGYSFSRMNNNRVAFLTCQSRDRSWAPMTKSSTLASAKRMASTPFPRTWTARTGISISHSGHLATRSLTNDGTCPSQVLL